MLKKKHSKKNIFVIFHSEKYSNETFSDISFQNIIYSIHDGKGKVKMFVYVDNMQSKIPCDLALLLAETNNCIKYFFHLLCKFFTFEQRLNYKEQSIVFDLKMLL